ncbi:hypothetical protein AVEN_256802-1, partial [Araneus ventricosus]
GRGGLVKSRLWGQEGSDSNPIPLNIRRVCRSVVRSESKVLPLLCCGERGASSGLDLVI